MPHALQVLSEVSKHEVTFKQALTCVTSSNIVLRDVRTFSELDVSYFPQHSEGGSPFLSKRRWPINYMRSLKKELMFNIFVYAVGSSLCLRDSERLFRLTNSFIWKHQPTRNPHTGHRTLARWIPHLHRVMKYGFAFAAFYYLVQWKVRICVCHELVFSASGIRTRSSLAGNTVVFLRKLLL
jgi:hypothetical protein